MVKGAVKYKNIVYLLLSVLLIVGVYGLFNMNKDEFPTFEINQGLVAAVYPGADVDQVEQEVAKPLEDFLFTMPEVNRSATKVVSKNSICYIYVDLNTPSAKKTEIWSKIRLKLDEFKMNLPAGVLAIVVMDDFSELTSILVALESEDKGYTEMRGYARDLSDRLHRIPTLGGVKIIGEQSEEIAVHADMDKFSDYGISPRFPHVELRHIRSASPRRHFQHLLYQFTRADSRNRKRRTGIGREDNMVRHRRTSAAPLRRGSDRKTT